MSEYPPGTVADVEGRRAMLIGKRWCWDDGGWVIADMAASVHPLVVLDPEDAEQVKRLSGLILRLRCRCGRLWLQESSRCEWHKSRHDRAVKSRAQGTFEELADALREFANPKPPRPAEPEGLGAVVEDAEGFRWVHIAARDWYCEARGSKFYAAIDAVKVLSEGVTA